MRGRPTRSDYHRKGDPMKKQAKPGAKRPTVTALAKRTPPKKKAAILRAPKRKITAEEYFQQQAQEREAALRETGGFFPLPATTTKPIPPDILTTHRLDESIALGEFGLVEVKFTAAEELVLSTPIPMEEMRVLPTGQVYLSHPTYTRLLNKAFGRTGWALRPASKPLLSEGVVVIPYLLMVHGKPVAFALGEQVYHENNKDQTYGDALEATVASGLRRTCKHLGIGLELWDRSFNDNFLEEHCVKCWKEGSTKPQFRRKVDAPFWWEKKGKSGTRRQEHDEEPEQRREPPRDVSTAMHHPHENEPITEDQVRRFWTVARRRGRTEDEIKAFLLMRYNIDSTKKITRKEYESCVAALEHPGPMDPTTREPGEDDA